MTTNDRKHFNRYRDQTRVKHEILAAYLPAYFNILKKSDKNLVFIDGFAGRGSYTNIETGETFDGSPIRALKLIAEDEHFNRQVSAIFIESDSLLFSELKARVVAFCEAHPGIRKPLCLMGTFTERVNELLDQVEGRLAPTFLFVDPCGVSGASFQTIKRVMDHRKCEAFIFFNIDGVRRIAGLNSMSNVLVELMGTEARARRLCHEILITPNAAKREHLILEYYRAALREDIGAQYVIPFRVEHEDQHKASHYLIHATKHPLGFKIMKDVMWRRGHSEEELGALEFRQSSRTNFIPMFDVRGDVKQEIVTALKGGPLRVSVFYDVWTTRPDDVECEASYRQSLLELEAGRTIEVLSKNGKQVCGIHERPRRKGRPTLARDYFVRLKK